MPRTWAEKLSPHLASVDGLFLGRSRFADKPAYFHAGSEVLHFHGDAAVDLKLGRRLIRARREELARDGRVALRRSTSADWLEVTIASRRDLAFVLELVRAAVAPPSPARAPARGCAPAKPRRRPRRESGSRRARRPRASER